MDRTIKQTAQLFWADYTAGSDKGKWTDGKTDEAGCEVALLLKKNGIKA